jgi:uncharacterized protein (TIRG00374 family)
MSWRRWLITIISFAAAIGVSVYLVYRSWREAGTLAALPVSGHLLALAAMTIEVLARVGKLQLGSAAVGVPLSFMTALRVNLGGDFGAGITPSRSGSEPARFLILSESGMRATPSILILFVELFLEMTSVLLFAIVLSLVFRGAGAIVGGVLSVALGYCAVVLGLAYAAMMLARHKRNGPPPRWARAIGLNALRWRRVQGGLRQLRERLSLMRSARRGLMVWAFVLSLVHVAARLSVLPALVFSYDRDASLGPLVLWPLALIYGGNATPIPAGGGVIEVAFRGALGGEIPEQYFASTLIWWRIYTFYILLLLGAFVAGGTVMRALRGDVDEPSGKEGEATPVTPATAVTKYPSQVQ